MQPQGQEGGAPAPGRQNRPARTPAPVIARLNTEIVSILKDPLVIEKLRAVYMEPAGGTPAAFAAFMQDELRRWGPVIRRSGASID